MAVTFAPSLEQVFEALLRDNSSLGPAYRSPPRFVREREVLCAAVTKKLSQETAFGGSSSVGATLATVACASLNFLAAVRSAQRSFPPVSFNVSHLG